MVFTLSYVLKVLNIRFLVQQKHLFEHFFKKEMKLIIALIFITE